MQTRNYVVNWENIAQKTGIIILCIITAIFFALSTRQPEAMGESDDYMLATEALQNHFSLRITEDDIEKAMSDFPEHAWYFEHSWEAGMPALFSIKEGEVYPWYMGTYSLACIPMKVCLEALNLNQSYAFPLTNAILAALALWISFFQVKKSAVKRLLLIIMLGFSPIWWYIRWPSAEVMIFSLVVLALCFFSQKNYHLAGIFVSLAGTLNIAIMALGLAMIIDFVKTTYGKYSAKGEKNVFRVMRHERKAIILLILCYIPSLITPIFNLVKFGLMNLQSILGFATAEGYLHRVLAHLFDLNIGFLPYFLIAFIIFIVTSSVGIFRKNWNAAVYLSAFVGTVCLYSVTYHINSGMEGLPRYSAWTFPIFIFYIVIEKEFSKKWLNYMINALLLVSTALTVTVVSEQNTGLVQTKIAQLVLNKFPEAYNPYYPIFISRVSAISGGYTPYQEQVPEAISLGENYESYLPVMYCDQQGNVRKILSVPELDSQIINYLEGTQEDMQELQNKITKLSGEKGLHYINLHGNLKIKAKYVNNKFAYTYGNELKPGRSIPFGFFKVTNEGTIGDEEIVLQGGDFLYGPYKSLPQGKYQVTITGENLTELAEDVLADNKIITIDETEKTDEKIQYIFEAEEDIDLIEIRGLNEGEGIIKITEVLLEEAG